ncbi:ribonuclease R [Clostridia bacterium OttesenSCG-928-F22]|nr:ribonuclease R [Clostridia bacterium OttesenSCG-928-F22]
MNYKKEIVKQLNIRRKMDEKDLRKALKVKKKDTMDFYRALSFLQQSGEIEQNKRGAYKLVEAQIVEGHVIGNAKGFGFLVRDDGGEDVFLPPNKLNGAMNHDTVSVKLTKSMRRDGFEGEIVEIKTHANELIVGTYHKNSRGGYVIPDDGKLSYMIKIGENDIKRARNGQKVVVQMLKYGRQAWGRITQVIGYPDEKGVGVLSILCGNGLGLQFPKKVREEAKAFAQDVPEDELKGRVDYRDWRTFTIDGADAKDLDDAVSIMDLGNGLVRLGVHIADVSHYVKLGGALDKEALKRGTSVYPVDRVIPMLPEELSNGICSLNPRVNRLTMSCVMDVDNSGDVVSYEISKSVIRTCHRMTYDAVSGMLQGNDALKIEYQDIDGDVQRMAELAKKLQAKREKRGCIDFEIPEAYIELNEESEPVAIKKRERNFAHKLIEEFMLLANETVAKHMADKKNPLIYRVHEKPDEDRINDLNNFLAAFSLSIRDVENVRPEDIQHVVKAVSGTPTEKIVGIMTLRSMKKARYSQDNLGHFGLAAKYYCHFTSPIRRYPDLVVHRMLKLDIANKLNDERKQKLAPEMAKIAQSTSECEVKAMETERDVESYMKARYMESHIGEEFEGSVSGATFNGLFVELDNTVEGYIQVSSIGAGYEFDAARMEHWNKAGSRFGIGDKLRIRVLSADAQSKRVDFEFISRVEER